MSAAALSQFSHPSQAVPRARGRAQLTSKPLAGRSVIDTLHQSGSLKVVFPRSTDATLQGVTVNTAGGVTGGDQFEAHFTAAPDTRLTLTTQAAERAYRSLDRDVGAVNTTLDIQPEARINWVPQETIVFDGARMSRHFQADLTGTASLLFVEPLILGRQAGGERLRDVRFTDRVDIRRDGQPIFTDRMQLTGDVAAQMDRYAAGAAALASIVYCAPEAEAALGDVRAMLPQTGGASLLAADLLHIRLLAADGFGLRHTLIPILERLNAAPLPRVWRL